MSYEATGVDLCRARCCKVLKPSWYKSARSRHGIVMPKTCTQPTARALFELPGPRPVPSTQCAARVRGAAARRPPARPTAPPTESRRGGGDGHAAHRRVVAGAENSPLRRQAAVEHVDEDLPLVQPQPLLVRSLRQLKPSGSDSPAGRSRTMTTVSRLSRNAFGLGVPSRKLGAHPLAGDCNNRSGHRQPRGLARCSTSRRSRAPHPCRPRRQAAQPDSPGACDRLRPPSSQPPIHRRSMPGHASAAACSVARICDVRTGAAVRARTATTSSGAISHHRTGFRLHPHA
mgnify:CR=1 FL=1